MYRNIFIRHKSVKLFCQKFYFTRRYRTLNIAHKFALFCYYSSNICTVFPRIESVASIFSHRLTCGLYSSAASIWGQLLLVLVSYLLLSIVLIRVFYVRLCVCPCVLSVIPEIHMYQEWEVIALRCLHELQQLLLESTWRMVVKKKSLELFHR